jgi:hypothetical protein
MSLSNVARFSDILKVSSSHPEIKRGCLVDSSILFAASYTPDRFNKESEELFEFLAELQIPLVTNINIRSEFMNQQRRVMIPEGLSDLYTGHGKSLESALYSKLQSVYTMISGARKTGRSYKFDENQIKSWRKFLGNHQIKYKDGWLQFCADFLQGKIEKVWDAACDEFGINFLSLRESDRPEWLIGDLSWDEMAAIIGKFGIASSDAMIINLFLNSHFMALITADEEIASVLGQIRPDGKFIVVPDSLQAH